MTGSINTTPPVIQLPPGSSPSSIAKGDKGDTGAVSVSGDVVNSHIATWTNATTLQDGGAISVLGSALLNAASKTTNGILIGAANADFAVTAAMTNGQLLVGQTSTAPLPKTISGDATLDASGALTLAASGASAAVYGSTSAAAQVTVDAKGRVTSATSNPMRRRLTADTTFYVRTTPRTVTMTIASPGVAADIAHGLVADQVVIFTTSGALPTGLTVGTIYYVKTVTDADHYTVAATVGGTAINTSGSQSGTQKASYGKDIFGGVAQTVSGAFGTIQGAWNWVQSNVDPAGFKASIQVAAGTFTENVFLKGSLVGGRQGGDYRDIYILGDATTPTNCKWQSAAGAGLANIVATNGALIDVQGFDFVSGGSSQEAIQIEKGAVLIFGNVQFEAYASGDHIFVQEGGHCYYDSGSYVINGAPANHIKVNMPGDVIIVGGANVISLPNALAFTNFVISYGSGSNVQFTSGLTFSGTGAGAGSTGAKYFVGLNGSLVLNGVTLPGATAGSTGTGGQVG